MPRLLSIFIFVFVLVPVLVTVLTRSVIVPLPIEPVSGGGKVELLFKSTAPKAVMVVQRQSAVVIIIFFIFSPW